MIEGLPEDVAALLRRSGALLEGHFQLSSGLHSGHYLQCARLCAVPAFCEKLAAGLADQVRARLGPEPCETVLAPALGGIVVGYELARQLGARAYFAEREAGGQMALRRGFALEPAGRVLIAEDVITTGRSVLEVADLVGAAGARLVGFACLFDRSDGAFAPGPPLISLARLALPTYPPGNCPLCRQGRLPAVKPGSRPSGATR